MEQAWDALLSNTLVQVKEENIKQDSILSAINCTYIKVASGHITSVQMQFDKLFVKVVCTTFSLCTTAPTKNTPRFEHHKNYKNSEGRNLQVFTCKIYQDMQAHVRKQIEKMSKVIIGEIKVYRKD